MPEYVRVFINKVCCKGDGETPCAHIIRIRNPPRGPPTASSIMTPDSVTDTNSVTEGVVVGDAEAVLMNALVAVDDSETDAVQ